MAIDPSSKALLRRLLDQRFHSGTELAGHLGVTRATVWNHVQSLQALGLRITALPGKGYRLQSPVELLEPTAIQTRLTAGRELLKRLEIHDALDSTNDHLLQLAHAGAPCGTVCLAEHQRSGRGRMGRHWVSPFGANIYLSVLWRFDDPSHLAGLSLAVGVALIRALKFMGFNQASLKWPNDILCGASKLSGILIDVAGEAHGPVTAIIGLGLNRHLDNQDASPIDQPWIDLERAMGGSPPPRNALIAAILDQLLPLLDNYPHNGLSAYLPEWREAHAHQGRAALLQMGASQFEGTIVDVNETGMLVMELEKGERRTFASGEIRLRVKSP